MAPPLQDLRRRAYCKIYVNGRDVTSAVDPHLISVTITDRMDSFDSCLVELDDRDGRLEIPPDKVQMEVYLGWAGSGPQLPTLPQASGPGAVPPAAPGAGTELGWEGSIGVLFQGWVTSVESGFARGGGGRRLWIEATGPNLYEHGKTPNWKFWGEGEQTDTNGDWVASGGVSSAPQQGGAGGGGGIPLSTVFSDVAKKINLTPVIHPAVGAITRDYWFMGETPYHFFERIGRELGVSVKVTATELIAQPVNSGVGTIDAYWGINLIAWRLRPYAARPQYKAGRQVWFDVVNAKWRETKKDVLKGGALFGDSVAEFQLPAPAPNRQVGDQYNEETNQQSQYNRGYGWATINGEPQARARKLMNIYGARPGVDGLWLIGEAEHHYTRNGGYITRCELRNPGATTDATGTWEGVARGAQ